MHILEKNKKIFFLLTSYVIILFTPKIKAESKSITVNKDFNIETNNLYGTYNNKNIYIGYKEYIEHIANIEPGNIFIIDERTNKDPDISIYNSYNIKDLKAIKDILNIILEYEKNNPSNWKRSYKSMKNEWLMHNICYFLNHEIERTKQVDFDNSDEELYKNYLTIINEILNNQLDELIADEISNKTLIKK